MNSLFRPIYPIRLLLVRNVASRKARHQPTEDFGNLSRSGKKNLDIIAAQNRLPDDADGYDEQNFDIKPRKNEYYYKYEIKNNARKGKNGLRKALELFQQMKSEDRLTPHFDHFTVLIYGCAKAGQTKLAFDLYDEGLKYFKRPSPAMVTCLINACAECPFPDYGIERLDWFRAHLKARYNFEMREIHYHCLMKGYGKLGRIDLAVKVMQEMVEAGIQPTTDSFNMLMIGCASQKDTGALLALRIYKRMRLFEIKPNSITYNNFLRCIHYCGMGSPELLHQTLVELPAMTSFEQRIAYKSFKKKRPIRDAHKEFDWLPSILSLTSSVKSAIETKVNTQEGQGVKMIEDGKTLVRTSPSPNDHEQGTALQESFLKEHNYDLPNLLSDDHLNLMQRIQAIQFDKLNCGIARFQLFGGAQGFLDIMKRDGCEPDIRILTRLCSIVEPDESGILPAFHLVKEYPVKRGELFYNNLIKSICSYYNNWKRMDLALSFLEEMHRDGIRPSVETFESLAPACDSMAQALTIIEDIERCGFVVSDELVDQLIRCACRRKDFEYMIGMIEICRNKFTNFLPSRQLLEHLEATIVKVNHTLVQHEKGNISTVPRWINQDNIAKFDDLKRLLGKWLKSVETQEEEHPWKQYDVKKEAKRQGFVDYARKFQALERVKKEAQERGEEYGNLYAKVRGLSERN